MALKNKSDTKLYNPLLGAKDFIKYIGPGLLVTVGFIDPGNWASNLAAGSDYDLTLVLGMLYSNSYRRLEKWIIGFVSLIGVSFIYELSIVHVNWGATAYNWAIPSFPSNAMPIIMSVLGAVVMPHNLFLHSEIIQSREWNLKDHQIINKQLKYEFMDTLFSMLVGWAINSAMIILAAAAFFSKRIPVTELVQAQHLLEPMLGKGAALVFGMALLFAGIASTITAGMAGGSIVAGMFKEPYDINDLHTKIGLGAILSLATVVIFWIGDPFKGLIYSQMLLSIQLPITIFLQIYLTSSSKVMGRYRNSLLDQTLLWLVGIVVTVLNIMLIKSYL